MFGAVLDGSIYAILAGALLIWKSRISAVLLVFFSGASVALEISDLVSQSSGGRTNIGFLIFILLAAIRATQASFLFHGKFANEAEGDSRVITSSKGQPERKPKD